MADRCLMGQPLRDWIQRLQPPNERSSFLAALNGEARSHREHIHNAIGPLIKCISEVSPIGNVTTIFHEILQEKYSAQYKRFSPWRKCAECEEMLGSRKVIFRKVILISWSGDPGSPSQHLTLPHMIPVIFMPLICKTSKSVGRTFQCMQNLAWY